MSVKKHLLEQLLPDLEKLLTGARWRTFHAFNPANAASKAEHLKRAGAAIGGALLVSQLWLLYANIAVVTAGANEKGVDAGTLAERDRDSPLLKLITGFRDDPAILALAKAGMNADVPAMLSALPAGTKAYDLHLAGLDRWVASINRGAVLSKKVIQVADITLIAISIYQVWKLPAVTAGGSPMPPTILGTLPGGAALGSVVSLPSLARALESIRRLVAIGALDGALIGGIGMLGGGPSIALPELQRPTSLSVQGTGSGTTATPASAGRFDPPKASLPLNTGGKTTGVLHIPGQEPLTLTSGVKGPSQAIRGQGVPGFNGNQLTHVEGHAAAHMRTSGAREAVLDINKAPCTQGSGGGCQGLLERMLPKGARLRVRYPDGEQTFVGSSD
jgi:hypothetical protein